MIALLGPWPLEPSGHQGLPFATGASLLRLWGSGCHSCLCCGIFGWQGLQCSRAPPTASPTRQQPQAGLRWRHGVSPFWSQRRSLPRLMRLTLRCVLAGPDCRVWTRQLLPQTCQTLVFWGLLAPEIPACAACRWRFSFTVVKARTSYQPFACAPPRTLECEVLVPGRQ